MSVAALAWTLDTMAQRLFVLSRTPALMDLMGVDKDPVIIRQFGGYATAS